MEKAKSPAAWIMQWSGKQKILYALSIVLGFCSTLGMFIGYEENFKNAVEKTKALNNHYDCA